MVKGGTNMASKQNVASQDKAADEITYLRPVSNCSGCGDTKVSWSVREGMRRFNRQLKLKGKDRYELIYAADRGCGNLQGYHAYGIVDAIFCMGTGAIVGDGIKESCSEKQIVVTASGDGAYNFNISGIKFAAKNKKFGAINVIYNNYNIRMTGGQIPLEVDFDKEGPALGFEVIHINPYRVDDNAELFKKLYPRYLNKEKIMVVADGVCVLDMGKTAKDSGIRMGHFIRSNECLDLKFAKKRARVAREEPEKLKDLPKFKCRLCGIGLRCHALLDNDPGKCFGCGACIQFPCPVGALSFEGPSFSTSINITELKKT
jgi:TPP-dependent indolepyruvate ferredoxin oxidoreductase alpha subunit